MRCTLLGWRPRFFNDSLTDSALHLKYVLVLNSESKIFVDILKFNCLPLACQAQTPNWISRFASQNPSQSAHPSKFHWLKKEVDECKVCLILSNYTLQKAEEKFFPSYPVAITPILHTRTRTPQIEYV
jgi:hypothetical protein